MDQIDNSNHKSIRVEVEVKTWITIKETIKIGTDKITDEIVDIEDSTDKAETNLEMNQDTNRMIQEVILEEMLEIMVDKIVEESSTETTTEMTVMVEVGTGPEIGWFPEIMAIIELEAEAIVDLGKNPDLVQIGIEYIVISVGNMITSQESVPLTERKGNLSNFKECSIWEMSKQ